MILNIALILFLVLQTSYIFLSTFINISGAIEDSNIVNALNLSKYKMLRWSLLYSLKMLLIKSYFYGLTIATLLAYNLNAGLVAHVLYIVFFLITLYVTVESLENGIVARYYVENQIENPEDYLITLGWTGKLNIMIKFIIINIPNVYYLYLLLRSVF